ncbi:PTS sugar transporter subunit IIA [Gracilibacillus alcaliphilus]|uniref:PTS sugar transporter subunit IIA n=1 Tax=Gracilibacillus alcaliphilus TaxID=1401441 RepID=UPI00195CD5B8|nr:PTS glucose transporter subunit IIA [Gracilibacillus alcaliphilus]MBM7676832.1 PTS system glucose-specific IIA component [Gracilibacillus alcaliphilus]
MFFKKRKKNNEITINSPLNGELISLEEVPDPVFSQKMMGEGVGFIPTTGEVFSPVAGEITQVFPTQHAIGIITDEGVEVLLHLGLGTVELKGEGFNIEVSEGDKLNVNDKIGDFDLSFIEEKGKKTTTVLVFTNFADKVEEQTVLHQGKVESGQEIVELKLK